MSSNQTQKTKQEETKPSRTTHFERVVCRRAHEALCKDNGQSLRVHAVGGLVLHDLSKQSDQLPQNALVHGGKILHKRCTQTQTTQQ